VGDSFEVEAERSLNSIEVGDISIWLEVGPDTILAVAIRGEAPAQLRTSLQQTLEQVQRELGDELANFKGDVSEFEERQEVLRDCLQAQYREESSGPSPKTWIITLLLLLALAYWLGTSIYQSQRYNEYADSLKNEPGYIVTDSYFDDGVFIIEGLRDPSSRQTETLLSNSPLDAAGVSHRFKPYQSLDAEFVEQRARKILDPPAAVTLAFNGTRLIITGSADLAWRETMLLRIPLIAGIDSYDDTALQTRFTPAMLASPPGVSVQFEAGMLYVEGAAEHDWIQSLAAARELYAEIEAIDTRALVDLTEVALVAEIAQLEKQSVFFDAATSYDFETIDASLISTLCKNIIELSNKLSRSVLIVVRGYSDSIGSFEDNLFLSRERADFVAQAIFNTGISPRYIAIKGIEVPVDVETSEAERRFNRRVGFEVIVE